MFVFFTSVSVTFMIRSESTLKYIIIWINTDLTCLFLQPTVHFAEETIIRGRDDDDDGEDGERSDDEDERPTFPAEKQRLIRKDTPHYKKHFKITKLPKPEAVAALLQGFGADGLGSPTQAVEDEGDEEEEDDELSMRTPQRHHRVEELDDSRQQVNNSQVKVKERRLPLVGWLSGNEQEAQSWSVIFLRLELETNINLPEEMSFLFLSIFSNAFLQAEKMFKRTIRSCVLYI